MTNEGNGRVYVRVLHDVTSVLLSSSATADAVICLWLSRKS